MPKREEHAAPGRRAVLGASVAVSVLGLTGCGIRLDDDAPDFPGIGKKSPPADQDQLRTVLTDVKAAIMCADQESSAWAGRLARIHRVQRRRLTRVMATQGMTPAPSTTASAGGGPVPDTDPLPLAVFEHQLATRIGSLAHLSTRNLPMAAAIGVTHGAAAQVLDKPAHPAGGAVPTDTVTKAVLPSLQAAVYAFEVIVAKTPLKHRKKAESTLAALRPTRASWEAALGDDAPQQPDGYELPVQPTSDATRTKLARRVLTDLIDACAGQVAATEGDKASFIGLTGPWVDATAHLWRWGAKPAAFPGLR